MLMDEVITGFRWSSGGAQKALGVTPDLCILAKIVAGGLPGGAVAGKRDLLDQIDFAVSAARKRDKIAHPGTFNANPLSAAAAVTALSLVRDEDLAEKANRTAAELRARAAPGADRGERAVGHLRPVLDLPDLPQPDRRGRSIPRPSIP